MCASSGLPQVQMRRSGRASQYSDEPSMQVNAAAVEKAVKTAFRPSGPRKPGAMLRSASRRPRHSFPGSGRSFSLPNGFHTCGKVLWIGMAVTSVEQAAQGVWARVTEKARSELPEGSFTMWFSEVRPTSLEGDVLQLGVPSEYVRDWLVRHYNPLFIYGGVGLGKTHLLFATGHHMIRLMPGLRVKYVTSETFVTEFIKAVRERQGYQFQRRYRDVDVLLVDDIQFLARREETQTEFFHTFNALHEAERQIVIASDRPPQELSGMEERLRNRFRWGLCVDVQPPDLETRIAILQLKAQRDKIVVPNEVMDFIASKFDQNIRELEGALLRAAAFSSLTGQPIAIELAERALADLLPQTEIDIPPALIVDETAAYFGLTRADLVSKNRSRPLTTARHIAMYLLRETTSLSLIKIGEIFDRDHSTAMHGINKVQNDMSARGSTYRQVQDLTRQIRSRVRGG